MDLADGLHDVLDVDAGIPGEARLLMGDDEAEQGGNGDLSGDLGEAEDEQGRPGLADELHLEGGFEEAEGGNGSSPVDSLEQEPGGGLAHKMDGGRGEHGTGDLEVELGLGLVQERTVREDGADLVVCVRLAHGLVQVPLLHCRVLKGVIEHAFERALLSCGGRI